MKKYKLLKTDFIFIGTLKLYRIVALKSFSNIIKGDYGGYIEKDDNLTHTDSAWVYDNAIVYDNAKVYDSAKVYGSAIVYDNARVCEYMYIIGICDKDIQNNKNLVVHLEAELGSSVYNNKVILYKSVMFYNGKYYSHYDNMFEYKLYKNYSIKDYEPSIKACASGLHATTLGRARQFNSLSDPILVVEIDLKDIICIQEGKVRCKKLKVLDVITY